MINILFFLKCFVVIIILLNVSCSSNDNKDIEYVDREVDDIYNSAIDFLEDNKYFKASDEFEEVERQHPYSIWATRAQIMGAYAKYKTQNYDATIAAAQRYIDLHPGANDIDYAFYLISLSYYERINDVKRDQSTTNQALVSFNSLINRFPNSEYTKDAKLKLDLINDHLAGKEMDIGRTYINLSNYLAAINRFKKVVESYSKTSHVPEALARLTELYLYLGIYNQAKVYAAVLGHNYSKNKWYLYSYQIIKDLKEDISSENKIDSGIQEEKGFFDSLDDILNIFESDKT